MLFDSIQFILFYIVVTLAYYSLRHRSRIWMLLLASCYFYIVFKPVYIFILFFTILVDYFAGILIENAEGSRRKVLLVWSLITNIGFLAFFKYYNFFHANLSVLLGLTGLENPLPVYPSELPIGLSFHTFQAMSYTIEVYRGKQKTERDFGIYALYVMFYPQLVAGPIERPQNLLHQFHTYFKFSFDNLKVGLLLMLWGFFKKVVLANRLGQMVDYCYDNPSQHSGLTLLLATFFYTFQIYCDFSGYSDIAIGSAKTMGFDLMKNFDAPYQATSISAFWRRWHISLSTWFKDYLYIPLGGSQGSRWQTYRNYLIVFSVSGLWHGASWNFIIWGMLHGVYLVLAMIRNDYFGKPVNKDSLLHLVWTFVLVMFTWVFFRAQGLVNSKLIFSKMLNPDFPMGFSTPYSIPEFGFCWLLIACLLLKDRYLPEFKPKTTYAFVSLFLVLIAATYLFGIFGTKQFIYFQF